MEDTVRVNVKANFIVSSSYRGEKEICLKVENIIPDTTLDLQGIISLVGEIEESSFDKNNTEGINFEELEFEYEYEAEGTVELVYSSFYESWSGATEYDLDVFFDVKNLKRGRRVTDWSSGYEYYFDKKFGFETNNAEDYLKLIRMSEDKIYVDVGHCCLSTKKIIHPMSLTKMLFEYKGEEDEN